MRALIIFMPFFLSLNFFFSHSMVLYPIFLNNYLQDSEKLSTFAAKKTKDI